MGHSGGEGILGPVRVPPTPPPPPPPSADIVGVLESYFTIKMSVKRCLPVVIPIKVEKIETAPSTKL